MGNTTYKHDYRIGDAVLADMNGAQIPGVVEDKQGERILVRLSQLWTDEAGRKSDEAWLTADKLDPSLEEETGGTEALPG